MDKMAAALRQLAMPVGPTRTQNITQHERGTQQAARWKANLVNRFGSDDMAQEDQDDFVAENASMVEPALDPEASGGRPMTSAKARIIESPQRSTADLRGLEDAELLARFQQGEERAFYALYERRHKEIYTHCIRMCNGDAEKAQDAFQDTFVKVFTRKELFANPSGENAPPNGRAWLYRIATNTCLNMHRYDKRHPHEELDVTLGSTDPKTLPDFATEQDTLRGELERAIAKLPLELKEPFLLREIEELSYEEISEQLGLTVAACRQRVYRAKQMLREELEEAVTGESKKKSGVSKWLPFTRKG